MNQKTEQLIRRDIQLRWSPLYLLFWLFVGSVVGFALLVGLGCLDRLLRSN